MLVLLLALPLLLPPAHAQDCGPSCPAASDLAAALNSPQALVDQAWALLDAGSWADTMARAHANAESMRKDMKAGKLKKAEAMGPITTLGQIYELAKKMKAVQDLFDRQRYSSAMYEAHRLAETLRQRIAARQIDGTRGLALVARLQDLHGRAQAARPATAFPFERGAEVTSNYGWRIHPVYGDRRFHQGTDIGLDRGADVYASGAGTVEFAGWISGYGRQMQVRLDDGALVTYSHLLNYNDLSQGDRVSAGDVVGHVNASGIGTGDHLHLEVWDANGNRQNPRDWFDF